MFSLFWIPNPPSSRPKDSAVSQPATGARCRTDDAATTLLRTVYVARKLNL